jgi:chaperonin GroES
MDHGVEGIRAASWGNVRRPLDTPALAVTFAPALALHRAECQKKSQQAPRRKRHEEKTKGGLIIPDSAKEKPIEGDVVAVGNGKILEDGKVRALDIKVGDRVLFSKYAGTEIKIDGEENLMMREEDILGVVEK